MALSPYTFRGALSVLDLDRRSRSVLDRLFGTAIFAGAGAATVVGGPVAGITAAAWLSLVDPKNEAVSLLDAAVSELSKRLRGTKDQNQLELIATAHTITAVSSFFDALQHIIGPVYRDLALTDTERRRLLDVPEADHDDLFDVAVPLSSPKLGMEENLERNLKPYYEHLGRRCLDFFTGLEAWTRLAPTPSSGLLDAIVERAAWLYRSRMLELSPSAPFGLWVTLNEFSATRELVRAQSKALGELHTMLAMVMPGTPAPRNSYREKLSLAAREILDEPLLRSRTRSVASPTVRDGFVEPSFHHAVADHRSRPADEGWWSLRPEHSSLVDYLASYLASPEGARRPLLLLGHPGAGKSLLTEVLAAQLPADAFAVVRVPLRSINPDDDLTIQINKELQRTLQRPQADLDELRQECGSCEDCDDPAACPHRCRLVVLLDGFDELVQATGATQSAYLTKVEAFQKRARTLGTPTSVIVTSRTVVADRADIAPETPIIKLREFDRERVGQWLAAWNAAHGADPDFAPLELGEMTESPQVSELTCHPLLLLMLAVYLAELGTGKLGGADLTQSELYQRIIDRFISRQVTEKTAPDLSEADQKLLEHQQRRRLQYAALGMFNRGRQHITDTELNADLTALEAATSTSPAVQPLSSADRVLGEFMFVHNPRADREQRSAYEFLHATFGEYLVAELVLQHLARLTRYREVEAGDPALTAGGDLDDSFLRRLLSHQPLSTRQPTLTFVCELAPADRRSLLETITQLLRAHLNRPDTADDLYGPLPYDPVRRRAAYTANLVLLRVVLDDKPVPITALTGDSLERWQRCVRLWRAGLDHQAWFSVIETLGTADAEDLALERRTTSWSNPDVQEAELVGERETMAQLIAGHLATDGGQQWSVTDLTAIGQLSEIHFTATGTPGLQGMLPWDEDLYEDVVVSEEPLNSSLRRALLIQLSRTAGDLPDPLVKKLLARALPPPADQHLRLSAELAAVVAAKPALLDEIPALGGFIMAVEANNSAAVIAILWRAEQQADEATAARLRDFRKHLELRVVRKLPFRLNAGYFTPEFVTYLRTEQPGHWTVEADVAGMFEDLPDYALAAIEFEDAMYVARTWPTVGARFLRSYIEACGGLDADPRFASVRPQLSEQIPT
ncbi:hypothetical protein [Kribbella sp. NPDC000426]|uniref:NACHT domain-containing protein n=1 Tax=Kribbella sp. NPDC000426 TaxID=3154255 RepID=UPI003316F0A5